MYATWTKYLSWFLYTNEALSAIQWENVTNIQCEDPTFPCLETGKEVLKNYSFDGSLFSLDLISMITIYAAFHVLGVVALSLRSRRS